MVIMFQHRRRGTSGGYSHDGRNWGKGEIGLWSGHTGGKRRNRRIDDGTSQGFKSGKEDRQWVWTFDSLWFIAILQVYQRKGGATVRVKGYRLFLIMVTRFLFMLKISQSVYQYFDCGSNLRYVVFWLMFSWLDNEILVVKCMVLFDLQTSGM